MFINALLLPRHLRLVVIVVRSSIAPQHPLVQPMSYRLPRTSRIVLAETRIASRRLNSRLACRSANAVSSSMVGKRVSGAPATAAASGRPGGAGSARAGAAFVIDVDVDVDTGWGGGTVVDRSAVL